MMDEENWTWEEARKMKRSLPTGDGGWAIASSDDEELRFNTGSYPCRPAAVGPGSGWKLLQCLADYLQA
jgi:hypothetical protein